MRLDRLMVLVRLTFDRNPGSVVNDVFSRRNEAAWLARIEGRPDALPRN